MSNDEQHLEPKMARPGDWIEADAPGRGVAHRGLILEVLGREGHEHYRVRWDEQHESIYYPADGARFFRAPKTRAGRGA